MVRTPLLALLLALATWSAAAVLSVPNANSNDTAARAQRIAQFAAQIKNEPRSLVVKGTAFPLYFGPAAEPGSLAAQIQLQELSRLRDFGLPTSEKVATFAGQWASSFRSVDSIISVYQDVLGTSPLAQEADRCAPQFASLQDYVSFYDLIAHDLEKPWSTDNSDAAFGAQRFVMKGFTMREVLPHEYMATDEQLTITDEQLRAHCGRNLSVATIRAHHALFVSEFHDVAQYNDPDTVHRKYVPNVIGFFCFNADTQQLLPMEIRLPSTGLSYTPFDSPDEWTLAKMALEATEIDFQNMQHMAETHAMTIPMRVEAYRTMDASHPVFELFTRHVYADFALEMLSEKLLLNISTEVDKTFGFGATGSIRFIYDRIMNDDVFVSVANDFPTDVQRRGLHHLPTHKYAQYGALYYRAMDAFVAAVLDTYYASDAALQQDSEVQQWASACAQVPHLRDFPSAFDTKEQLRRLLTHVIFQSTFKHHAMNGVVSWHGVSMPFAVPALWHPLPTHKGASIDLLKYTVPRHLVADQVRSPAAFYRAIPLSETLLDAYRESALADEPKLAPAIKAYESAMRSIDRQLAETEAAAPQPWPYHLYRPTKLAFYTWI